MHRRTLQFLAMLGTSASLVPACATAQAMLTVSAIVCEVDHVTLGFYSSSSNNSSYGGAAGVTVLTTKDIDGKERRLASPPRIVHRGEIVHVRYTRTNTISPADVFDDARSSPHVQTLHGVDGLIRAFALMDRTKNPGLRCDAPERPGSKKTIERP